MDINKILEDLQAQFENQFAEMEKAEQKAREAAIEYMQQRHGGTLEYSNMSGSAQHECMSLARLYKAGWTAAIAAAGTDSFKAIHQLNSLQKFVTGMATGLAQGAEGILSHGHEPIRVAQAEFLVKMAQMCVAALEEK